MAEIEPSPLPATAAAAAAAAAAEDSLAPTVNDARHTDEQSEDSRKGLLSAPSSFVVYPFRWYLLALLWLLNVSSAINWITFATVDVKAAKFYETDKTFINWFSVIFFVMYLVISFPSTWALDIKGLKFGLLIGCSLNVIGAWLRYVGAFPDAESKMTMRVIAFIGQTLCAAGQPFLLNAPTKLAADWFGATERTVATGIGSLSQPMGVAIAQGLIPAIVEDASDMPTILLITAIISSVAAGMTLFVRDKPPTPPSASAENRTAAQSSTTPPGEEEKPGKEAGDQANAPGANVPANASTGVNTLSVFFDGLKALRSSVSFLFLIIIFGVAVGLFNAFATLLPQLVEPYGFGDDDAGYMGISLIAVGLVAAGVTGPLVDQYGHHLRFLRILSLMLVLGYFLFAVVLTQGNTLVGLLVATGAIGFGSFSLLPVALEVSVDLTFPETPEATSSGILWTSGNAFGILFVQVLDYLQSVDTSDKFVAGPWWFFAWAAFAVILLLLFLKGPMRRFALERSGEGYTQGSP